MQLVLPGMQSYHFGTILDNVFTIISDRNTMFCAVKKFYISDNVLNTMVFGNLISYLG